jgi:kinesin family protein 6/9
MIHDQPDMAFTVRMSYLEIYNEQMIDLLKGPGKTDTPMTIIEDKNETCTVKGLSTPMCNNEAEGLELLFEGETNRTIASHLLNNSSTRSHCIFSIYLEGRPRFDANEKVLSSKLTFVDLAGSERLSKTKSEGIGQKEASCNIFITHS